LIFAYLHHVPLQQAPLTAGVPLLQTLQQAFCATRGVTNIYTITTRNAFCSLISCCCWYLQGILTRPKNEQKGSMKTFSSSFVDGKLSVAPSRTPELHPRGGLEVLKTPAALQQQTHK
jgi:hypothetical protein